MDNIKDKTSSVGSDNYVRLKIAKLCSATYLVTNFMSNPEPVKWRLRKLVIEMALGDLSPDFWGFLSAKISQVMSLIDLALLCPGISRMNFNILKQEYQSLISLIEEKFEFLPVLAPPPKSSPLTPKGQTRIIKPSNESRRNLILSLIKQKGPLSIKDIAGAIPNVGAKTIQRELAALVQSGLLKKEGEKRWSRYSWPPAVER